MLLNGNGIPGSIKSGQVLMTFLSWFPIKQALSWWMTMLGVSTRIWPIEGGFISSIIMENITDLPPMMIRPSSKLNVNEKKVLVIFSLLQIHFGGWSITQNWQII